MPPRPDRQERIQADLDELLGQCATLAKALLVRNGEFFPFGATIGKRGKFSLVTPAPGGDRPSSHDVIDALLADFGSSRDSLRAVSIAALATTESGAEVVRIELEHAQGSSITVALPYSKDANGVFGYEGMDAHRGTRRVWPEEEKPRRKAPARAPAKSTATKGARAVRQAATPSTKTAPRSGKRKAGEASPHRPASRAKVRTQPVRVG